MNLKIRLLSTLLLIGIFTGCSTKQDVVVDTNGDKNKVEEVQNIDDRLSSIKTNGIEKETIIDSGNTMSSENVNSIKDYNEVESSIAGETVIMRSIHFGFDVYSLNDENQHVSIENAKKINDISKNDMRFKVKLEGNCDEWGTDEYNYALGLKRAATVKKDLIRNGISEDRIVSVSYGESNPVCNDKTASCWKKNRRVDYRLLP